MKKFRIIGSVLVIMLTSFLFFGCNNTPIEREDNTEAVILQISDIHIKNKESKDKKAFKTIRLLVEKTKPDIIVVSGDITSEKDNLTAIKTFSNFMETEIKLPWAFTYGNHDAEGDVKKTEISEYLESLEYCIFERGDETVDGEGNYWYNVKNKEGKVIQTLFMLDSNMYNPDESIGGYDKFHDNQIDWYEKSVKSIAFAENGDEKKIIPSLAFFHIPMREFKTAFDEAKASKKILYGNRKEKECSANEDDMMFEKMLELGSTKGLFVGHDHMNNYSVDYKGIRMTYANSADHNIYLVPHRGGCLIRIKSDGSFTNQSVYRMRGGNSITMGKEV